MENKCWRGREIMGIRGLTSRPWIGLITAGAALFLLGVLSRLVLPPRKITPIHRNDTLLCETTRDAEIKVSSPRQLGVLEYLNGDHSVAHRRFQFVVTPIAKRTDGSYIRIGLVELVQTKGGFWGNSRERGVVSTHVLHYIDEWRPITIGTDPGIVEYIFVMEFQDEDRERYYAVDAVSWLRTPSPRVEIKDFALLPWLGNHPDSPMITQAIRASDLEEELHKENGIP